MTWNPMEWNYRYQSQGWRIFLGVGIIAGLAIGLGWGWPWGLFWGVLFGVAAVLVWKGIANPVIVLLALSPGLAEAQAVELGSGWYVPGKWTAEPVNHVRLDPGHALRFTLSWDRSERVTGYMAVTRLSSTMMIWPEGEGDPDWWDPRPAGYLGHGLQAATLTCTTAGARLSVWGPLQGIVGGGGCFLRTNYSIQGASPTFAPHAEFGARGELPIQEGVTGFLEAYVQPTLLWGHEFVRDHATGGAMERGARQRGNLILPTGVDLGVAVEWPR